MLIVLKKVLRGPFCSLRGLYLLTPPSQHLHKTTGLGFGIINVRMLHLLTPVRLLKSCPCAWRLCWFGWGGTASKPTGTEWLYVWVTQIWGCSMDVG